MAPLLAAVLPNLVAGVFSLFGANKARQQAQADASNKFVDLRAAAEKAGFNPLTALEATGGSGFGSFPSAAPPLASVELLTGALSAGVDELTGAAAQRRASDRLNLDLAALKLDQARSGFYQAAPVRAAGGALGHQTAVISQPKVQKTGGLNLFFDTPAREEQLQPVANAAGYAVIDNGLTGKLKLATGPDGDILDIFDLAGAAIQGLPQMAINFGDAAGSYMAGKGFNRTSSDPTAAFFERYQNLVTKGHF